MNLMFRELRCLPNDRRSFQMQDDEEIDVIHLVTCITPPWQDCKRTEIVL